MNTLQEIAARASIPLECGELIREQLRKPTIVYIPYEIKIEKHGMKCLWFKKIFSTKDQAINYDYPRRDLPIEILEYPIYDFDPLQPIYANPGWYNIFFCQERQIKEKIAQLFFFNWSDSRPIYRGLLDGKFSKYLSIMRRREN